MERLSFLSADYLSMDSRLTSDMDDTADEAGTYTDNEPDMEMMHISAISRSSEPVTAEEVREQIVNSILWTTEGKKKISKLCCCFYKNHSRFFYWQRFKPLRDDWVTLLWRPHDQDDKLGHIQILTAWASTPKVDFFGGLSHTYIISAKLML